MATTTISNGVVGSAYGQLFESTGGALPITYAVAAGALPAGLALNSTTGLVAGTPTAAGAYSFSVRASDARTPAQTDTRAFTLAVSAPPAPPPPPPPPPVPPVTQGRPAGEIVIYAANVSTLAGTWTRTNDATAAGGVKLATADAGWSSPNAPLAAPADYFEATFNAPAGSRYQVSLRLQGAANSKYNESVWVQFNDSVTSAGTPAYRIGTTAGLLVNLEDCFGCGISAWGWQNKAYWLTDTGEITLATGGNHTVRVQVREDGVHVDQIVLTPVSAAMASPGALKNDATIIPMPAPSNIVLYAADVPATALHGAWTLNADATAAQGVALVNPDAGWAATAGALASPTHYVDIPFTAPAGTTYKLWLRMKAAGNSKWNDSVYVQLSDARANGQPAYPIGTASGLTVNLAADATGASLNGWGWENNAYWLTASQPVTITFDTTGTHTIRVQVREDGVSLDQIVLSPDQFSLNAPGLVGGDATIVAK